MDLEHGSKTKLPAAPAAATPACQCNNKLLQLGDRLVAVQPVVLRAAAALATAVAAAVMALNTQSYTAVVAIIGTKPLMQTFTAKFRYTPAFVIISFTSLLLSLAQVIMALLATGAATAASMAELGKKGNLHARWNPICDKFGSFCSRGGIAIVSSLIGVALMLALNLLSAAANAHRPNVVGQ
nr:unnamed protein product [Digitaria exilis]